MKNMNTEKWSPRPHSASNPKVGSIPNVGSIPSTGKKGGVVGNSAPKK